jgi:hypothetical protein
MAPPDSAEYMCVSPSKLLILDISKTLHDLAMQASQEIDKRL